MRALFSYDALSRTYRDPIACLILVVDVFPILAILWLRWRAEALVFLYWLENLVIGGIALAQLILVSRAAGPQGLKLAAILGPFFIFHFGLFCYVHGIFLHTFVALSSGTDPGFLGPLGLVARALSSGAYLPAFLCLIIALQIVLLFRDFLQAEAHTKRDIRAEMSAPYQRIVILHLALFAGAASLIVLGDPLLGVLALLGLRILWGVYQTSKRRLWLDSQHLKS